MAAPISLPTRCPRCGQKFFGGLCRCSFHDELSHDRPDFNPRCALCWAETWTALLRSPLILA
jgi:hypothetical protein